MLTQRETHLKVKEYTLVQEMRYIRKLEVSKRKNKKRPNPVWQELLTKYNEELGRRIWDQNEARTRTKGIRQFIKKPNRNFDTAGRESLRDHRVGLKEVARGMHLARGYLQGMPYRVMERLAYDSPQWRVVWEHVVRFSNIKDDDVEARQKFMAWADTVLPQDPAKLSNQAMEGDYANGDTTPSYYIKYHNRW